MDFTKMSKQEVIEYLLANRNNSICGRINLSQLDFHHTELEVMIDSLMANPTQSNRSIWLLAMISLALVSCETELSSINPMQSIDHIEVSVRKDTSETEEVFETGFVEVIMGEIALSEPLNLDPNDIRHITEVMPEFGGGVPALYAYLNEHVVYPGVEKQKKITGRVFVQFVVEKDGSITNIKILKSLSEHFDKEVLRVFDQMPNWTPGLENGKPVRVQMVLPVVFEL
jgi:TonB family protein